MTTTIASLLATFVVGATACDGSSSPPAADAGGSLDADVAADATPGDPDAAAGTCTEGELAELEDAMATQLDLSALDPEVTGNTDFTVLVESSDGRAFSHTHGSFSATTAYESASTSKWVTATVLLELVDQGDLALDTLTTEHLDFWETTPVTLRDLLSFTSGYADDLACINSPGASFAACVETMYLAAAEDAAPPGAEYEYGSLHMQLAGLMAIEATGAASWTEIFAGFQARTGLFPSAAYDLPSAANPRLAGGMTLTGEEYLGFLRALFHGDVLTPASRTALLANQRGDAEVVASPAYFGMGEDWSYGLGNWLECRTATELGTYDCGEGRRSSSAGAYGAYPFLDRDDGYFGIVAQQGALGSGDEGAKLFRTIELLADAWARRDCSR